jgi:guanylate kinase
MELGTFGLLRPFSINASILNLSPINFNIFHLLFVLSIDYLIFSKKAVKEVQEGGRICILDVDIKGVQSLRSTDLRPRCVFIQPPSLEVLEQRLRGRGTETEESITKRLNRAIDELKYVENADTWDMIVVNDNLESAYEQLKSFLHRCYQL